MNILALIEHVDHFQQRSLQDALADATRAYWLRRAEVMEWAKPKPGDYPGQSTLEQRREAWRRCDQAARACHAKAALSLRQDVA